MLSYHADESLKAAYVTRARQHREADEIVQGTGWDGKNGCLVGCLAQAYPAHEILTETLGVPEDLLYLADQVHEGLPDHLAKTWPERFVLAVPVGVDLALVKWCFTHWLLTEPTVNPGITHETVRGVVNAVAELCLRAALGETPRETEWSAGWSARSAMESATGLMVCSAATGLEAWVSISEKLIALLLEAAQPSEVQT